MEIVRPNLIAITPNCFIVRTQAGFHKLCKKLHCKSTLVDNHSDNYYFTYKIYQYTHDENAYFKVDGSKWKYSKQYPIKYPCIISYLDETFERSEFYFHIRYFKDDLKMDELESLDLSEIFN